MTNVNRRNFIKQSFIVGAGMALIPQIAKGNLLHSVSVDIAIATGTNYFEDAVTAVENLGGISKFAPRNSKVGLLINAPQWWTKPGTYTHPDVVLAVLKLLNDAGVSDITYLISPADDFYKRTQRSENYKSLIAGVKQNSKEYKEVEIPNGVSLKKASIIKDLFECDVFINIPKTKHHAGVQYTNCLKNFMGACHGDTNKFFHKGGGGKGEYDDVVHLSQCIADVNLVRKPDLCVSDASELIRTNGPFGPGEIIKPMKVYAGTDPVAMDAYANTILDNRPADSELLNMASKHHLGRFDIENMNLKEIKL
jgi:uncharacterized protein (DUF362 family)